MHALLAFLAEQSAVDQAAEITARQYFSLQDKGWPSSAKPNIGRPLLIDGLALVYLQTVDLLDTVLNTFKDVYVHADIDEETSSLIEHDRHTSDVLKIVDDLRSAVRQARAAGKIIFGPRRTLTDDESEIHGADLSTLHLLSDKLQADMLVFDDRAFNKETFAQDGTGHRAPIATSLDLIEELLRRELTTEDERRHLCYRDRRLLTNQDFQFLLKHVGEWPGEGCQKYPRVRTALHEARRPMQRNDCFASPSRARDAGWTGKVALDDLALRWMKKDRPFLPRKFQSTTQLFGVLDNAKSAQGIGMGKCITLQFKGRHLRDCHLGHLRTLGSSLS
jgi:hypothetical protein